MTKITLNNVSDLTSTTTAQTTINANNAVVVTAMDNTLSRDGTSPNQMNAPIDMNSNQVLNLPNPATAASPLRLQDLTTFVGGGTVSNIPTGGTTGQVLAKTSNTNYQIGWTSSPLGLNATTVTTNANLTGPITSVGNATSVAAQTGTGSTFVMNTSPTLVTPNLGVATGTSLNLSGLTSLTPISTDASKNLISSLVTGTGSTVVLQTSPALITPALGTPTSGVLTNCTGTASGLTAGNVTTNANLTGPITSVGNATSVAVQTGTGSTFVMNTSPTLVTPNIGAASGTSLNLSSLSINAPVTTDGSKNLVSGTLTGSGAFVLGTSPTMTTPNIVGTSTNNNAAAGSLGEYVESIIPVASLITLTSNTLATLTSISLTAGDWDVSAIAYFETGAATNVVGYLTNLSLANAAGGLDTTAGRLAVSAFSAAGVVQANGIDIASIVPRYRFSLATTTSVFMNVRGTFSADTLKAWGIISARRIR